VTTALSPGWVFDPIHASGRRSGGDPTSYIFGSSLDIFVREVGQNSHDQNLGDGPVRLAFDFFRLTGGYLDRFRAAIKWNDLSKHLSAVARTRSLVAGRVEAALESVESDGLLVLRITDSGTYGLRGGEDDHGTNFNALCRDVLVTTEEKAVRGGSHGLGKAVLWGASGLFTVMFSSRIEHEGQMRFRLFGRTDLPYHEADQQEWDGPGFFGIPVENPRGWRAESVWDIEAEAISSDSRLDRPTHLGSGTTLMILGFTEPEQEHPREPVEVATDILKSASRWFWPSIQRGSLVVSASVRDNDDLVFTKDADISEEVQPFVDAWKADEVADNAVEEGQVAERQLTIRVPARKATSTTEAAPETEAAGILRLTLASDVDIQHPLRNKIALVRGAGMVVEYWRPLQLPLDGEGFFAVLQAGQATGGGSQEEEAVEAFLRAAEPPAHDKWVHWTNQIKSTYQLGAKARLDELWGKLTSAVLEMCHSEPPPREVGPQDLARLFPIGSNKEYSPGPTGNFSVLFDDHSLDETGHWCVRGRIRRHRGSGRWAADVEMSLQGESGRPERLDLESVSSTAKGVSVSQTEHAGVISVPADVMEVPFEVKASSREEPLQIVRRTRVRADVRPRAVRGGAN
jgi:hypothetical protein